MNFPFFIAQRLGKNTLRGSFSAIVTTIAIAGIAIGVFIMLIAFAILEGFQGKIKDKLFSFGGHIIVTQRGLKDSYQDAPLSTKTHLKQDFKKIEPIEHLQVYAHQAGVLKTDSEVMGVILKGVGEDFHRESFAQNMKAGKFVRPTEAGERDVVISQKIATKLRLKVGDAVNMFFIQQNATPRFRKLTVSGIYETGMEEFDERIIFGHLRMVQRLKNWADTLVGGYEIRVKRFEKLDSVEVYKVAEHLSYEMRAETITQRFMGIFDWLRLLGGNVQIFLTLILIVASVNIISILLILIMERVQMIGVLKALGATNAQIRTIFIIKGMLLILKGMAWGNVLGLGFCALQYYFPFIPLDADNYYMHTVPIAWNVYAILGVNVLVFGVVSLVLLLPTLAISRIQPIKAIRFD